MPRLPSPPAPTGLHLIQLQRQENETLQSNNPCVSTKLGNEEKYPWLTP